MGSRSLAARLVATLVTVVWASMARPSSAELVVFTSGRSMSVASHETQGDRVLLKLRAGGELTCAVNLIDSIQPDEVPYPAPTAPAAVTRSAATHAIDPLIDRLSADYGVEPALVRAVVRAESAYQPQAVSRKGAQGLMQLMPATAARLNVTDPFDPGANLSGGIQHLRALIDRYHGKLDLALAAYNAGEAVVERFRGLPPFPETRQYVGRVLSWYRMDR